MTARRWATLLPLAAALIAVALRLYLPGAFERLWLVTYDTYQQLAPRPYEPSPVRIVDIDDASLAAEGQWPWPRTLLARLTDRLTEAGAAVIAFDIVFAEPDRTSPSRLVASLAAEGDAAQQVAALAKTLPDHDTVFAAALGRGRAIIGNTLTDGGDAARPARKAGFSFAGDDPLEFVPDFTGAVVSLPELSAAAAGDGSLNDTVDADGVVRRVPLLLRIGKQAYPTLVAEALRVAQGARSYLGKASGANGEANFGRATGLVKMRVGRIEIPTDRTGQLWVHFSRPAPERYLSAKDVIDGKFDRALVDGNIVLIGTSAAGLKDLRATPLNPAAAGVEVHAQALEQILSGHFISRPDLAEFIETIVAVLGAILLALLAPRIGATKGAIAGAVVLALIGGGSWFAFTRLGLIFDPVYPGLVITMVYVLASLIGYLQTEAQQRQIRSSFALYLSPHMVDELAAHPERLTLGGEMRQMTVMFCDIRGFTTISEGLDAQHLTRIINRFLSPMTEIVMEHQGTIDKYIGDCIMAFWNAPLDDLDHAAHAVAATQAMRRSLAALNAGWEKEATEEGETFHPIRIGIGLNTGECCVGNMGSEQRFAYSALGDAVNLASRLEGMSKFYGVELVLSETTAELLDPATPLIELDRVRVKGKKRAVRIFTLLAEAPAPELLARHNDFLDAYRRQDWPAARRRLEEAASHAPELDALYALYRRRIEEFESAALPEDWDGVYVALEK